MATHDLDFAEQVSDNVAMMFDGEIALHGASGRFLCRQRVLQGVMG